MRPTACKLKIEDLVNGEYTRSPDGAEPSYLLTPWKEKITRGRVLGTVVDKFIRDDRSYGALRLDDGSETIRVRAWAEGVPELDQFKVGDVVDIIGRAREFQGEVYLVPEPGLIIPVEDSNLESLRELDILKTRREALARGVTPMLGPRQIQMAAGLSPEAAEEMAPPLPAVPEELKTRTVSAVEKFEEGATVDNLVTELNTSRSEVEDAVHVLLVEGKIFEPMAGRFKAVR
jgi:RPA family protein